MSLSLSYQEILLRLVLTLAAGALVGLNRERRGEKAGLRTNMLVALAASVAMIQANLLLGVGGRPAGGFSTMDVMRLPLGILSGMGFIGAGAILRRGELVIGVTTAATLWTVTVIGLCFGGGQYGLGILATLLSVGVIWLIEPLDHHIAHVQRATLEIAAEAAIPVRALVEKALPACDLTLMDMRFGADDVMARYEVKWRDHDRERTPSRAIAGLRASEGVRMVEWRAMTKRG